ncbi:hypothetical protein BDN72DRAFT_59589 [Pluteus cervinus]|uniref:Uncharacterized protein n=1 Tax=Pluteus cervinus TaxID=181527 RepID=A0ACD3AR71_9AGAR|nr:hypothetical protein BDN72DRAFT_59589 [Pluteus cervinus]
MEVADSATPSPATTFTSLPHDVLVQILQRCDEKNAYRLAWTCRVLHVAALTVLFTKYTHGIEDGRLILYHYPSFILPALHGALFVQELRSISISIQPGDLRRDLRILRDLLGRTRTGDRNLRYLTLNFGGRYYFKFNDPGMAEYDFTTLLEDVRGLLDFAITKGCHWVDLQSEADIQKQYFPTPAPTSRSTGLSFLSLASGKASKPTLKSTLDNDRPKSKGFWHKFQSLFGGRDKPTETGTCQDAPEDSSTADAIPDPLEQPETTTAVTSQAEYPLISSYADMKLYTMSFHSQLFFEEPLRDWTFNLIQTALLTVISIDQDAYYHETWLDVLPQLHFPHVQQLTYNCCKQVLPFPSFTAFINRHAKHLSELTLRLYTFPDNYSSPSNSAQWAEIDFPALRRISCSPDTFNWIIFAAYAYCTGKPDYHALPDLEFVYFRWFDAIEPETYWTQVDQGILSLSALSKHHIPKPKLGQSPEEVALDLASIGWLTELVIDCGNCEKFASWLTRHVEKKQASPFASFRCLETLEFCTSYGVYLEDKEMKLLLHLFALVPSLRDLALRTVKLENVKEYGVKYKYWHLLKKACPRLEDITLNYSVRLKMEDLLNNEWPEGYD